MKLRAIFQRKKLWVWHHNACVHIYVYRGWWKRLFLSDEYSTEAESRLADARWFNLQVIDDACEEMEMAGWHDNYAYKELKKLHKALEEHEATI